MASKVGGTVVEKSVWLVVCAFVLFSDEPSV